MTLPASPIYVSAVHQHELILRGLNEAPPQWLQKHQLQRTTGGDFRLPATGGAQVILLQALRDHGVAFAGGAHSWPPAEVFADLRDRGLVYGEFEEVVFLGADQPMIRKR